MQAVARELLGEPSAHLSSPAEWRYGTHGSLSIDLTKGTFYDHEADAGGGTLDLVMRQLRCERAEAVEWLEARRYIPERQPVNGKAKAPAFGNIIAKFDYLDENGERLFQVCKLDPPTPARFMQRREDAGRWVWNVRGVRRVPYRLPDLLARDGSMVVIAEGEKDVDRLWAAGIPATCNPGGAGKWHDDYSRFLRDADVVIVPDNDAAGRKHRDVVGAALAEVAASVRVLDLPGLPEKGDVSDWFDAGGDRDAFLRLMDERARPWLAAGETAPLHATPYDPADVAALKPRRWVYGHLCIRKYVSLIGAPGGIGKTAYTIAAALAIATGRALMGEPVHDAGPVWLYNLEDDRDEMLRRVAAAMKFHNVDDDDVRGRLFIDSGREQPLCIARRDRDTLIVSPQKAEIVAEIRARGVVALFIDPFVKSHRLEENKNEQIDFAASLWASVADEADCSVVQVHHFKKGGVSGESDAFRGASALIDAARSAISLQTMTKDEAELFAVPPARRTRIIRLDNAKLNLAPRPEHATWVELASVQIATGDWIQVARTFEPPAAFCGLTADQCNEVLDAIEAGREGGDPWSPDKRSANWVGPCVIAAASAYVEINADQAGRMVDTWLRSGVLEKCKFKGEGSRERTGLRVVAAKRPGAMPPSRFEEE